MPATPLTVLLADRMAALDLTPAAIVKATGAGQSSVYSWIAGDHPPAPNRLADLAAVLDVPLRDLLMAVHGFDARETP
jgi:transcriptional regulator with XRE-family HTH domain